MKPLRALLIASLACVAAFSAAKPPFLKVFMNTYKISPESALGKARCLICHQPPAPPLRNSYGKQVQAAMTKAQSRMVTAEILKSIEKLDGDGDHAFNGAEIKGDTLPGDAGSKPKKAEKPAKKKKKKKG